MIIKYSKANVNFATPVRANPSDAGLDIFSAESKAMLIESNSNKLIRTGLMFEIPHGYMIQVCNRSSIACKKQLIVGAHIVDSGYKGELFIDLHNIGTFVQSVDPNEKIAQLVMVPIVPFIPMLVPEAELYSDQVTISDRGRGALGSTGS